GVHQCGRRFNNNPQKALLHTSKGQKSQTTLFPGLTNFRHTSPCHWSNRDHGLQRELLATGFIGMNKAQSQRILKWLKMQQVWLSANNPHSSSLQAPIKGTRLWRPERPGKHPFPSQYIPIDRCIDNSVQDMPAFPLVGAY